MRSKLLYRLDRTKSRTWLRSLLRMLMAVAGVSWLLWMMTAAVIVLVAGFEAFDLSLWWAIVLVQDVVAIAICLMFFDRKNRPW